ncbi:MAG: DUF5597 domain-containing protein [Woeseiaceae bacterium]
MQFRYRALILVACLSNAVAGAELPRMVEQDGRHALFVDGKPYLLLCAQVNNSSNYPAVLDEVWPAIEEIGANTVQVPIAWEQVEPQEGTFDFSFVDTLLDEARANDVRLILLWFGAFKNTSATYAPAWVKLDTDRFPRLVKQDGELSYALTPLARTTLEADKRAFTALLRHLARADREYTVIMVQVENETGTYGSVRDYSPAAEALFAAPPPAVLLDRLGAEGDSWREATYASGGPTWNVLDIWKAAAPALDFLSPDIYDRESTRYRAILDHYARPDNALFVSEIGNGVEYARFFFETLGKGAIGFSPFGIDYTGYANYPLGARALTPETLAPFASNYRLLAPFAGEWARLALEQPVWGAARPDDAQPVVLDLGDWTATLAFHEWQFGHIDAEWLKQYPKREPATNAGALIAQLDEDTYLVTGRNVRVSFALPESRAAEHMEFVAVEEVAFRDGRWETLRRWNGDQIDWGLNFRERDEVLRVTLATYQAIPGKNTDEM